MIRFACGRCGRIIGVEAKYAGRKGKCPKCCAAVTVPERSTVISFRCGRCGHKIEVPEVHAGKKGKCPKCKNPVVVPAAEGKPVERANGVACSMCGQAIEHAEGSQEPVIECRGCGAYIETSSGALSPESGGPPLDEDEDLAEESSDTAGRRAGPDRRLLVLVAVAAAVLVVGGVVLVAALRSSDSRQVDRLRSAARDQREDAATDLPAPPIVPAVAKEVVAPRSAAGAVETARLQFCPIPGTKRTVQLTTVATTSTEMDGQRQDMTNTESVEWDLEVLEPPGDGTAAIAVSLVAIRQKFEAQGGPPREYDSAQPQAEGNTMAGIYGAYVGNLFTIQVSPTGEIVDYGLDALFLAAAERRVQSEDDMLRERRREKADQDIQTLDDRSGSREKRVLEVKKKLEGFPLLGREQITSLVSDLIESLPDRPLRRADTWEGSFPVEIGLHVPMTGTCTVTAVEPDVCTLQVVAQRSQDEEPILQEGGQTKTSMALAGSSEATLRIERRTGWLLSKEQRIRLQGEITMTTVAPQPREISSPISLDVTRTLTTLK